MKKNMIYRNPIKLMKNIIFVIFLVKSVNKIVLQKICIDYIVQILSKPRFLKYDISVLSKDEKEIFMFKIFCLIKMKFLVITKNENRKANLIKKTENKKSNQVKVFFINGVYNLYNLWFTIQTVK